MGEPVSSAGHVILALGLSTILTLAGFAAVYVIHLDRRPGIVVGPASAPEDCPLISICIPARNEARTIERCVEAALAQTYPRLEVIVIDDSSTDQTPFILADIVDRAPSLVVQSAGPLPPGWAGKPHALAQAAHQAHGTWLCFLDADTILQPEALSSCYVKALQTNADLFTILTRQVTGSFWEKAVMPLVLTALSVGFSPRRVNDPGLPDAVANGQFMLMRRETYDQLGGHAAIKDQIVDDEAIADLVKHSGRRLILADGRAVASTRMYTSLPEIWEGWTKNIYLGLRIRPGTLLLGAIGALLLLATALLLPVWLLMGLNWSLHGGGWAAFAITLESMAVWGALLHARAEALRAMGISRFFALTIPLGAGVFAGMMLTSAWKVLSGRGVSWRGRTYRDL